MENLLVILVTFSSDEEAGRIGCELVRRKLIACINCVSQVTSIYEWKGEICEEREVLGILKAKASHLEELERVLSELHSYETAEFIAIKPEYVSEPYLKWALRE